MTPKNDNAPKWFIVACRPSTERQAAEAIIALGQTVFVPAYRKEYRHHRLKKWIKKHLPLLPGYVFVMASDHWSRVLDCEHVTRILRSQHAGDASAPIAIADDVVRSIREAQDAGKFDDLRLNRSSMKPGDLVRVHEGAFIGFQGKVDNVSDESVVLLIEAMGREVRTTTPLDNLRQAG